MDREKVSYDSMPQLAKGLFLTKEQEEKLKEPFKNLVMVIRCEDCKHGGMDAISDPEIWCSAHSEYHDGKWFCADGERR